MEGHKLQPANMLPFILGGHALFTIRNSKSGNRFTYKVGIPKDKTPEDTDIYFVHLMTGTSNEDSFSYIGFIRANRFTHGRKSRITSAAPAVVAFDFVFNRLIAVGLQHADLEVWHEGKCCRCGRTLTVPESIESGIGPECARIASKHAHKEFAI